MDIITRFDLSNKILAMIKSEIDKQKMLSDDDFLKSVSKVLVYYEILNEFETLFE